MHWDGETLNPLTHASENTHIKAVLMTSVDTDNEVLLEIAEIPTDGKKGSTEECYLILSSLKNLGVDFDRVIGVVLDTTSINSGLHNGVAVQSQKAFGHKVMQLACRHHILEFLCGASCKVIFGCTESPEEPIFKKFASVWKQLDTSQYQVFSTT